MAKSTWYHYEYRNEKGQPAMHPDGSTGSIQRGKLKAWQIKNIERSLTEKHGLKCFVKLVKTESL
jgi:hypothetical protein